MKAIVLKNIGKKFITTYQRNEPSRELLHPLVARKETSEFWALQNINLEVDTGKVIGIIGRNGAGKTSLLNIIAGVSSPTVGNIKVNGRISSLISLGAGFHDELSGKENVYLNAHILGMNKEEIVQKYSGIVDFSELDGFLDKPLCTYSQGMRLRLAFSIAIHADFDILLIDEVISVGDVSFQKRCFDKIEEFRRQNKTIILTTQALDTIERFCNEVFLLENGEIIEKGAPQETIASYLKILGETKLPETFQRRRSDRLKWWADKRFWGKTEGSKEAQIIAVETYNSKGAKTNKFKTGAKMTVKVNFRVRKEIVEPHFGLAIFREDGLYCYGPNTLFDGYHIEKFSQGEGFFIIQYNCLILNPGEYRISVAIWDKDELWAYDYHIGFYKFKITGENIEGGLLSINHRWKSGNFSPAFNPFKLNSQSSISNLHRFGLMNDRLSSAIQLLDIKLMDKYGSIKCAFDAHESMEMQLRLNIKERDKNLLLWVGLFRKDDIYFHGTSKILKDENVTLMYPELPLLAGEYYFSLGVSEQGNPDPLMYIKKVITFNMLFPGSDHGAIYLEHKWKWKFFPISGSVK